MCFVNSPPPLSGVKLLKEFQAQYKTFENQRQELTNAEKLFDLPITMYADLMEVDRDLKNMAMVYDLYETQRVRGPQLCALIRDLSFP